MRINSREKFLSILKDKGYVVRDKRNVRTNYLACEICYLCKNRHKHVGLCALCIKLLEPTEYLDYEVES